MTLKEQYSQKLQIFENFHDFSVDVSDNTGGIKADPYLVMASQLYTRLTLTCLSIIHLLPKNRFFPSSREVWDFFSVATLARNLVENYHIFYYIGIDNISKDERDFRLEVLYFHTNNEKFKLYKELNSNEEILKVFTENLPNDKENLRNHIFFKTLTEKKQKEILSGNSSMYLTHKEISQQTRFSTHDFTPLYRLFSNHTHSSPLSFLSMSNERGRGNENDAEVTYLTITIEFCLKYLSAAILDMTGIFPTSINKLDKDKLQKVIERLKSYDEQYPLEI